LASSLPITGNLEVVKEKIKERSDFCDERAVLQARQEADWLYNIVVDVNSSVQMQSIECNREAP